MDLKQKKILTAVKESGHTITTSEGKIVHKKLASNPMKFQTSRKSERPRKSINRCRRCRKFSSASTAKHTCASWSKRNQTKPKLETTPDKVIPCQLRRQRNQPTSGGSAMRLLKSRFRLQRRFKCGQR